ncbi:unnamed protein product [Phaeothamnion confervicola]
MPLLLQARHKCRRHGSSLSDPCGVAVFAAQPAALPQCRGNGECLFDLSQVACRVDHHSFKQVIKCTAAGAVEVYGPTFLVVRNGFIAQIGAGAATFAGGVITCHLQLSWRRGFGGDAAVAVANGGSRHRRCWSRSGGCAFHRCLFPRDSAGRRQWGYWSADGRIPEGRSHVWGR